MNQADIISHVATKFAGKPRSEAAAAYNAVCSAIAEAVATSGSVRIKDLGTLKVVQTKARTARNPKTGATISIAAGRKVRFVPSQALKTSVASTKAA